MLNVGPNIIEVTVDGQPVRVDVKMDTAILDIDVDMEETPGKLAFITQLKSAAHKLLAQREAAYRAWRGRQLQEYLADEPRLAEWKGKAAIEGEPAFIEHKTDIAEAQELVDRLWGAQRALEAKADMLRSIGAMKRAEMRNLNIDTRGDGHRGVDTSASRRALADDDD